MKIFQFVKQFLQRKKNNEVSGFISVKDFEDLNEKSINLHNIVPNLKDVEKKEQEKKFQKYLSLFS